MTFAFCFVRTSYRNVNPSSFSCYVRDVMYMTLCIANFNFANIKNSNRENITSHEKWFMEIYIYDRDNE